MKAFTGFAVGTLAVLGAVAAVFIYLKKKTEKEIEYDQFDDIMDSDEDFDDEDMLNVYFADDDTDGIHIPRTIRFPRNRD